jgi:LVIVD repeat
MNKINSSAFMIAATLFILICVSSCGSSGGFGGGSGNTPVTVQTVQFMNSNGVNGNGNIVVASYTDASNAGANTGFKETLKIYQQDSTNRDLLLDLSSVYLGVDTLYHRISDITLNSQWATITMNYNELYTNQGWVALVPLSGPNYTLSATLPFNATLDRAVASGNWLLVASGIDLALYSISTPTSPVLAGSYSLSSDTTSMVALSNGFFVITNNGFAYLNTSDPSNITETTNADIKQSKKAYLIGNKVYIGGPSKYAGKIKLARIDVTTPSNPSIDFINDQIDGTFTDFSYDGVDGYYLQTSDSVKLYKESSGTLTLVQSVSLTSYSRSASQLYASNGRFYTTTGGLTIYRMP